MREPRYFMSVNAGTSELPIFRQNRDGGVLLTWCVGILSTTEQRSEEQFISVCSFAARVVSAQ